MSSTQGGRICRFSRARGGQGLDDRGGFAFAISNPWALSYSFHMHFESYPDVPRPTFLEGIRGIAAWMVVCGHTLNAFFPALTGMQSPVSQMPARYQAIAYSPLSLIFNARFAVIFFFIHSGLVLSFRFFVGGRHSGDLTSAATRRYFRLALPAAGSVFLGYALMKAGVFRIQEVAPLTQSGWAKQLFSFEPTFINAVKQAFFSYYFKPEVPVETSFNSSLWTIQTELVGSFFVFALLALVGRLRRRWIIYVGLVFIFAGSPLLSFLLGVILCDLYVQKNHLIGRFKNWAGPFLLCGLLIGSWSPGAETSLFYKWALPFVWLGRTEQMQVLGAFCIVIAALLSGGLGGFFDRKMFRFLGHISYSVYLLHLSVLCSLGCFLYLETQRLGWSRFSSFGLATAATYLTVLVLAVFYRKFVDKPAIAGSKLLQRRFFPEPAAQEAELPRSFNGG